MKERLIRKLLDTVIEMLTKEGSGLLVKTIIDDVVDVLENRLEADPTIFSKALMAAIGMLRQATGIPDDIGGDEDETWNGYW